jgi:hypothetical protein
MLDKSYTRYGLAMNNRGSLEANSIDFVNTQNLCMRAVNQSIGRYRSATQVVARSLDLSSLHIRSCDPSSERLRLHLARRSKIRAIEDIRQATEVDRGGRQGWGFREQYPELGRLFQGKG